MAVVLPSWTTSAGAPVAEVALPAGVEKHVEVPVVAVRTDGY